MILQFYCKCFPREIKHMPTRMPIVALFIIVQKEKEKIHQQNIR